MCFQNFKRGTKNVFLSSKTGKLWGSSRPSAPVNEKKISAANLGLNTFINTLRLKLIANKVVRTTGEGDKITATTS